MENQRETKTFKTPAGKDLVIKSYITARERNSVRDVFFKGAKIEQGDDGKPRVSGMGGEVMAEAESAVLKATVVSYDGSPENILDRLLDGDPKEYDFAVECVNEVTKDVFTQAK